MILPYFPELRLNVKSSDENVPLEASRIWFLRELLLYSSNECAMEEIMKNAG
jgi:hypothetical protein